MNEPTERDRLIAAIERVFPHLVRTDEAGEKTLIAYPLLGVLIEAVKELDSRLRRLEGLDPRLRP